MNKMWILADFETALTQLHSALAQPANSDLLRAGCIQYFEFTFELAWKAIKATSRDAGLPECPSPKACLKQAFANGWIDSEEVWLEMLEARNKMSHTYKAKDALTVYDSLPRFMPELMGLCSSLKTAST
jgi:nucleotidyltransferase substrate binding protein (TIGR01987 family)